MPHERESQTDRAGKGLYFAGILEGALDDPELGLILGAVMLVVLTIWVVIEGFFELMGGPPQNLFG